MRSVELSLSRFLRRRFVATIMSSIAVVVVLGWFVHWLIGLAFAVHGAWIVKLTRNVHGLALTDLALADGLSREVGYRLGVGDE